ncbi:retrovirus-related Pol polyprotein from transposon TNT 1-94 [Trichonephila inaurata madagascariensis]|uniref:Retrovirus-related Pol polyprotein from transposon TNT 1-94 n=1 Tax=Trichonephila inaurata madagascariensis TaxID=2747483 RepID=A0A8X6WV42_9ARAC|nr:retrovirus-related Pol polyprotein from transposon TNT 1-94 [Trichonephila inaurata madagascariensis]
MFSVQKSKIKCYYCSKFGHFRRKCRNGSTTASSSATNRRYREYRSPKLRRHPHVPSPIGSSVSSDEFHCNTLRGNKLIFKANLEQGLYYAYPNIEPKYASSVEKAIKIEGKPNDLMTWHERFGHANVDYILKTSRLDAVRGLPKLKKSLNFECVPCRLNKYKRVSFQSIECTRSKAPLNLLHCYVWEPSNVIGKRGEKYCLSVLDDYSCRMFIFPMCHKSDTYDILAKFIIRAERQLGLKIKAIHSDIGGEFIASILTDFLVERGIKHEFLA